MLFYCTICTIIFSILRYSILLDYILYECITLQFDVLTMKYNVFLSSISLPYDAIRALFHNAILLCPVVYHSSIFHCDGSLASYCMHCMVSDYIGGVPHPGFQSNNKQMCSSSVRVPCSSHDSHVVGQCVSIFMCLDDLETETEVFETLK